MELINRIKCSAVCRPSSVDPMISSSITAAKDQIALGHKGEDFKTVICLVVVVVVVVVVVLLQLVVIQSLSMFCGRGGCVSCASVSGHKSVLMILVFSPSLSPQMAADS